jgi:predicted TIM-barrel fold metal-dependent hydrolase
MTAIIDAHHHIWRRKDLPWLLGPMQPRIFGPYEAIKRDYPMSEYLAEVADWGVVKSVYVQVNWAPNWFEDEVAWVSRVAAETGWPHGIVGYADFTQPDVRADLDRLRKYPLMRGLRQQFHWHRNALYRFAPRPDLATDPAVQRNIAHLADYGWTFDLQVFAPQMEGAAKLAAACPEVTFILQHAGMLEDLSRDGWAQWRDGMKRLADQPNVAAKLSGLGTFIHRNDPEHIATIVKATVKLFGAERCLFGSNFPIEKLWTSYGELVEAYLKATARLSKDERDAIFHGTAARLYRLD